MKPTNITRIATALALVSLSLNGCKKDEKDPAATGAAAGQAAGTVAGATAGAAASVGKTGFAVFPASSKFIVGINLNSARSSALWAMYKPQIEAALGSGEMAKLKAACGFDPFTQVESVLAGGDPGAKEAVIVVKGIKRADLKGCGEKMAASEGKKFTVTDEGNLSMYEADGEKVWTAWLDDTTVVIGPEKDKAFVQQRVAGENGLADSAEIMGLLKNVDTSATLFAVGTSDAMGANPAAAMMPGAKGFFASLRLADGLAIDAGVRFDTPENAKTFTAVVQQQMGAMKGQMPPQLASVGKAMEKAQVKQNASDMVMQVKLTNDELKELGTAVQQMGAAFGQMGGAGGAGGGGPM